MRSLAFKETFMTPSGQNHIPVLVIFGHEKTPYSIHSR
jgi:hypothetical protein